MLHLPSVIIRFVFLRQAQSTPPPGFWKVDKRLKKIRVEENLELNGRRDRGRGGVGDLLFLAYSQHIKKERFFLH